MQRGCSYRFVKLLEAAEAVKALVVREQDAVTAEVLAPVEDGVQEGLERLDLTVVEEVGATMGEEGLDAAVVGAVGDPATPQGPSLPARRAQTAATAT